MSPGILGFKDLPFDLAAGWPGLGAGALVTGYQLNKDIVLALIACYLQGSLVGEFSVY